MVYLAAKKFVHKELNTSSFQNRDAVYGCDENMVRLDSSPSKFVICWYANYEWTDPLLTTDRIKPWIYSSSSNKAICYVYKISICVLLHTNNCLYFYLFVFMRHNVFTELIRRYYTNWCKLTTFRVLYNKLLVNLLGEDYLHHFYIKNVQRKCLTKISHKVLTSLLKYDDIYNNNNNNINSLYLFTYLIANPFCF